MKKQQKKKESWGNLYLLYIVLTVILFLFLVVMGYFAWKNDWLPHRSPLVNVGESS